MMKRFLIAFIFIGFVCGVAFGSGGDSAYWASKTQKEKVIAVAYFLDGLRLAALLCQDTVPARLQEMIDFLEGESPPESSIRRAITLVGEIDAIYSRPENEGINFQLASFRALWSLLWPSEKK